MIDILLLTHVIAGILALMTGMLIFFARKGNVLHVNAGNLYAFLMYIVFATGTYVSIVKFNLFLLVVGFFSVYMVISGVRYNRVRSPERVKLTDQFIVYFFALCFLGMLLLGIYGMLRGAYSFGIILLSFTLIGTLLIRNDIRYFVMKKAPRVRHAWKKEHIGRMTGSYIAAFTAFTVNNVYIEPQFIIWLLPTVLGIPLIIYFSKKYG